MEDRRTADDTWWQGAVIYHIYPRSFLDTTGNGVGDLNGIIAKLDYIASLGVDALWISPFVVSPMLDFGYDVADYRMVDPLFGTLEDFHRLIEEAHARGLRVLMDQVLSHTSDLHPWFLESRESRDNAKADWYVWADPRADGAPPNNWLSVFGGSSWQWEPRRRQYYLHNFLRQQPDLNFHNPDVQDAMLDICRYWFDLGVDGFRLDVCAFYFHDKMLPDNPPNPSPLDAASFIFNPYSLQQHVHDIAQPENLGFLERLRALSDEAPGRVLLGELHESEAEALHRAYTSEGRLQLAYGYWLLGADTVSAEVVRVTANALGYGPDSGWPAWTIDNHDFVRSASRIGDADRVVATIAALACLRGALCLYQGSELALPQADVAFERIIDPYGREFFPAYRGRDGSRTPMPWTAGSPHAGFSNVEPWLPISDEHLALNVADQFVLPGSPLNRLRQFLTWRRGYDALRRGAMEMIETPEDVLGILRCADGASVACIFNLGSETASLSLGPDTLGDPLEGHGFAWVFAGETLTIPPNGAYFGIRQ